MRSTTYKHQLRSIKFSIFFILIACLIFMFSCDTFEEDSIAEANPLEEPADITVVAQNSTVLDLKSVISINVLDRVSHVSWKPGKFYHSTFSTICSTE
ncbi:MAG: hypothetical protein AAGF85_15620 [Bacteroidota bacterium]